MHMLLTCRPTPNKIMNCIVSLVGIIKVFGRDIHYLYDAGVRHREMRKVNDKVIAIYYQRARGKIFLKAFAHDCCSVNSHTNYYANKSSQLLLNKSESRRRFSVKIFVVKRDLFIISSFSSFSHV